VKGSHVLDDWLSAHGQGLGPAGTKAVTGRGPELPGRPSSTWISFETTAAAGRLVLWSSGRCQLEATSRDGLRLCHDERTVTTAGELDDALGVLTAQLDAPLAG